MYENIFGKSNRPKCHTPVEIIKLNKKYSGKYSETSHWPLVSRKNFKAWFELIFVFSCGATQYALLCSSLFIYLFVCSPFLIWDISLSLNIKNILEYSKKKRFLIKNREQTDNKQTHRCKKLKLRPTPTKFSYQLTKMTGS